MKNIILIVSLVFCIVNLSLAQNKIDEATFNNLVDYISCRYANQYIQNFDRKNEADLKAYNEVIKPRLDQCKIDSHLSHRNLVELLKDNKWGRTADNLVGKRKEDKIFSKVENRSNSEIIDFVVNVEEAFKKTIGDDFVAKIKQELLNKYPDSGEVVASFDQASNLETRNSKTEIDRLEQKINELANSKHNSFLEIIQWGILLLLIGIFIAPKLFRKSKNKANVEVPLSDENREYVIKTVLESTRIANHFKPSKGTQTTIKNNTLDETQINEIVERVMEIIRLDEAEKRKEDLKNTTDLPKQDSASKSEVKYLKEKEGLLIFKETAQENAYYELFNIIGTKAAYRFCGNEERAIANYDAILKDVFDDGKTYSSKARRIVNVENGAVELLSDGKWKIINPAKIKLI